jgi:hypothetical protein
MSDRSVTIPWRVPVLARRMADYWLSRLSTLATVPEILGGYELELGGECVTSIPTIIVLSSLMILMRILSTVDCFRQASDKFQGNVGEILVLAFLLGKLIANGANSMKSTLEIATMFDPVV